MTKAEAIKIIVECAELYKNNLLNSTILFFATDKHKNVIDLEVTFEASNFLHLTGVTVRDPMLTANRFYDRCISHRLSEDDFDFPQGNKTQQKLAVMPMLFQKNLSAKTIGEFNGIGQYLYTEKIAGNIKGCMGFKKDADTDSLIPNTILKEDIRDRIKQPYQVIATYRKPRGAAKYCECVYTARKVEWERIKYPTKYAYIPVPKPVIVLPTGQPKEDTPVGTYTSEQLELIEAYSASVSIFVKTMHMDVEAAILQLNVPKELIQAVTEKSKQVK